MDRMQAIVLTSRCCTGAVPRTSEKRIYKQIRQIRQIGIS